MQRQESLQQLIFLATLSAIVSKQSIIAKPQAYTRRFISVTNAQKPLQPEQSTVFTSACTQTDLTSAASVLELLKQKQVGALTSEVIWKIEM